MNQNDIVPGEVKLENKDKKERKGPNVQRAGQRSRRIERLAKLERDTYGIPQLGMQDLAKYIKTSKENAEKVYSAVADLQNKVALTQRSLAAYAKKKTGTSKFGQLREKCKEFGIDVDSLPKPIRTSLPALVALDDWDSIKSDVFSSIKKYGPKILHFLIKKYLGGDEGYNVLDSMKGPMKQVNAFAPRVNQSGVGIMNFSSPENVNHVSKTSILAVLYPEQYLNRVTPMAMTKTALGRAMIQVSVTTNASGNAGVTIYPELAVTGAGTSDGTAFMRILNGATFDPATGTQSTNAQFIAGPFYAALGAANTSRVNQCVVEIQPSVSYNTPGVVTGAYYIKNSTGSPPINTMDVLFGSMRNQPYSVSGGVHTLYRMITPYTNLTDLDMQPYTSSDSFDGFQIYLTGCGSAVTFNFMITVLVEFVPNANLLTICPMDYAEPGPLTLQFLTEMYARYPVIWNLTRSDVERVCNAIYASPSSDYNILLETIGSALTGITYQSICSNVYSIGNELEEFSLDD